MSDSTFEDLTVDKLRRNVIGPLLSFRFFGRYGIKIEIYARSRGEAWAVLRDILKTGGDADFSLDRIEIPAGLYKEDSG